MDIHERLEIWSMNPQHNEATARVLWLNLDCAMDDAEMKVREAASACDKAQAGAKR